jgi:hypothetical protein
VREIDEGKQDQPDHVDHVPEHCAAFHEREGSTGGCSAGDDLPQDAQDDNADQNTMARWMPLSRRNENAKKSLVLSEEILVDLWSPTRNL